MMQWDEEHKTQRLWARDSSLWTRGSESAFMGWLDLIPKITKEAQDIERYADAVRLSGIRDIVLLGFGGSSLCARVFAKTFGSRAAFPTLHILDSTDPSQISRYNLPEALFIVSSKSGSTLETRSLYTYFRALGSRFIAITDAGSQLEKVARDDNFEKVFHGVSQVGGRFSALSHFGLVPAALIGVDIVTILLRAEFMMHACGPSFNAQDNPGVKLGHFIAENALEKRDKLTLLFSASLSELGSWVEQLIAESLGKCGKGVIPIDKAPLEANAKYSRDRAFVFTRVKSDDNTAADVQVERLKALSHPVFVIDCESREDLGAQFFLWEFATAVAGSLLGVNPFDQPDVEATKQLTRSLTAQDAPIKRSLPTLEITELFASIQPGDYFAINAFIEMNDVHEILLRELRRVIEMKTGIATTHGFGPCFLHSTGQLHKGGPNTGVFLQITCDDATDMPIPGTNMTFGFLKRAQAQADIEVLLNRGRRCSQYHISGDVSSGLRELIHRISETLTTTKR